ncbi:hypothetical protein P3T76_007873 [Phytophthora citrophthora]|uniref:Uncharacterized protein n=1 Tax=Phytophthora citrophthora TaxID=4793 RepID=A0AAD9GL38_9STRA|nr:hypothetical protein P3T76_007873 [Phytophthora citrophthora]
MDIKCWGERHISTCSIKTVGGLKKTVKELQPVPIDCVTKDLQFFLLQTLSFFGGAGTRSCGNHSRLRIFPVMVSLGTVISMWILSVTQFCKEFRNSFLLL